MKPLNRPLAWWIQNWGNVKQEVLWPDTDVITEWVGRGQLTNQLTALIDMMIEHEFYPITAVVAKQYDDMEVTWHLAYLLQTKVSLRIKYQRIGYLISLWCDPKELERLYLTLGSELGGYMKKAINFFPPEVPANANPARFSKTEQEQWFPTEFMERAWEFCNTPHPMLERIFELSETHKRFLPYGCEKPGIERKNAFDYISLLHRSPIRKEMIKECVVYLLDLWYDQAELAKVVEIFKEPEARVSH